VHRERAHGGDHAGQALGDVVEAAGEDRHLVAGAVHLDADAVELDVDGGGGAGGQQGGGHVGRALGQHRRQRGADPQADLGERRGAAGQRGHGDLLEVAGEQQGPAHGDHGNLGRPGDRVGQQPGLRPLPQLAAEQPDQQALLVSRGGAEQGADQLAPARLRAGARNDRDRGDRGVDSRDGQAGLGGGRWTVAQAGVADTGLPLAQLAGQIGRAGRQLVRIESPQRVGQ
jgi:hypothetical protein